MGLKCIDISYAQGKIDFHKVKSAGITTVIIRIGYGNQSSQKDAYFEQNYQGAKSVGMKIGGYWFSYATSISDALKEAEACLKCVQGKSFDLPIYYDMEYDKQASAHSKDTLTSMAKNFCNTLQSNGYNAGVYSNLNWFHNHLRYTELRQLYSIWLAQLSDKPDLDCDIWQYTWTYRVDGISTDVDGNMIYNSSLSGGSTSANIELSITTGTAIGAEDINLDAIDHYIITIDRKTASVNYTALKKLGVVGAMIEAGSLYTASHTEQYFRNPKLDVQAHAASDADIPFALYAVMRARSTIEANKEMDQLAFCIRKYPPALGVWLTINLTSSKTINNKIIDTYYDRLVSLGLKDRIGFYVTKQQLQQIDWDKYKDTWYLWWNSHVENLDVLNQLLTPEFFIL